MRTMIAVKIDAHVCTMCVGDVVIGAGVQRGGRERPDARLAALAWLAGWLACWLAGWIRICQGGREVFCPALCEGGSKPLGKRQR